MVIYTTFFYVRQFFSNFKKFRFFAAYCKRGEDIFTQLAELATTCKNLMADFRGKLANEEMLSHNVHPHPGKR